MPVLVALLRAVNVGGRKVAMSDLRAVAEELGFADVRTYIQSGNLLVTTRKGEAATAAALERGIAERCGVDTDVIVRSRAQLATVVAANPYLARGEDPKHLHVVFCARGATVPLDDLVRYAPEEVEAIGRELHLFLPNGMGRSKLAVDLARKGKANPGTARSWNTVTRLLAMADGAA